MELKKGRKITPTVTDFELASLIKLAFLINGLDAPNRGIGFSEGIHYPEKFPS